jgi:hypothetical protein
MLFLRRVECMTVPAPHDTESTLVELSVDKRLVVISLAASARFQVAVEREPLRVLIEALHDRAAASVPVRHAEHGERLLGVRPCREPGLPLWTHERAGGPRRPHMELDLELPDDRLRLMFWQDRLNWLITCLEDARDRLAV